jgi:hypothetical protein
MIHVQVKSRIPTRPRSVAPSGVVIRSQSSANPPGIVIFTGRQLQGFCQERRCILFCTTRELRSNGEDNEPEIRNQDFDKCACSDGGTRSRHHCKNNPRPGGKRRRNCSCRPLTKKASSYSDAPHSRDKEARSAEAIDAEICKVPETKAASKRTGRYQTQLCQVGWSPDSFETANKLHLKSVSVVRRPFAACGC